MAFVQADHHYFAIILKIRPEGYTFTLKKNWSNDAAISPFALQTC
jgi:hypothetical protein